MSNRAVIQQRVDEFEEYWEYAQTILLASVETYSQAEVFKLTKNAAQHAWLTLSATASGSPLTSEPDEQKPVVGAQVGAAPPLTDEQIENKAWQHARETDSNSIANTVSAFRAGARAVIAAMQHPSGGDQRTEGSGSSDRAQASAVRRPVGGERA